MTITPVRSMVRCTKCRCGDEMHYDDGCHTAIGFICGCKLTQAEVLGVTVDLTALDMVSPEVWKIDVWDDLPVIEDEALVAEFLPLGPAKPTVKANDMAFVHAGERF